MIFHIFENWVSCAIWERHINKGFLFVSVERHRKIAETTFDDIKLFNQSLQKVYDISQVGFYDYKQELSKNLLKSIFPQVNDIYFCTPKPWTTSPHLYACFLSGDLKYSKYKADEILEKKITIKVNKNAVIEIPKFTPLPLEVLKFIIKTELVSNEKIIFDIFDFDELVERHILYSAPEEFQIKFKIDTNTITNFEAVSATGELKLIEQDVAELYFRIPGQAVYFDPTLNGVGIDFGMTNCCAAVNRESRIEKVVLDNTGSRMLPTYVAFDGRQEICGQLVVDRLRDYSEYTVFDIKRILGNNLDDIEINEMWPFKLKNMGKKTFIEVETFHGRKSLQPEEIASAFLKHIKRSVDEFQGNNLIEVVITIPASYNETQKISLISAAQLAGWKIIHLLPEPIAAAFAYCDKAALEVNLNLLVFDLGGGTFDIFIVKTAPCMLNVLSFDGSIFLGGRDFDKVIINYFDNILFGKYGIEVMKNESKKYKLFSDCQEAKYTLSYQMEAFLDVSNYVHNNDDFITINRNTFEQLSFPLLKKIEKITQQAVNKSRLNNDQIDVVLYVGGGCKMPMIKEFLSQMFPKANHCCATNPDEMVAEGACLYACFLKRSCP